MGRRRTPTAILKLRGSRHANDRDDAQPPEGVPDYPEYLDDVAREEWRRLVPILSYMNVLTPAERNVLALVCQTWSRMVAAEQKVRETGGEIVKSPNGYPLMNPWRSIANKCQDQLARILPELGLTPSSRSRAAKTTNGTADRARGVARFNLGDSCANNQTG